MLIAFGTAVCITGYLAVNEIDDEAIDAQVAQSALVTAVGDRGVAGADTGPRPTTVTTEAGNRTDGSIVREGDVVWSAPVHSPPSKVNRGATGDSRTPSPGLASNPVDARGVAGSPDAAAGTGDEANRPLPAAPVQVAPAVAPEPAPDRWQLMNAAITRCGKENFFASVICEQRERLRYCDGFWGDVPQCSGGIRIDYQR